MTETGAPYSVNVFTTSSKKVSGSSYLYFSYNSSKDLVRLVSKAKSKGKVINWPKL